MKYIVGKLLAIVWGFYPCALVAGGVVLSNSLIDSTIWFYYFTEPVGYSVYGTILLTLLYSPKRAGVILLPALAFVVPSMFYTDNPPYFIQLIVWACFIILPFVMAWRLYTIAEEFKPPAFLASPPPKTKKMAAYRCQSCAGFGCEKCNGTGFAA